jgi:hypothetical protein
MQHASAARPMVRALAALTLVGALGASPANPPAAPTATDVLARVTEHDARVESYAVPVHIAVRLHKLITFHFGLNGMQYFKRPDRLALDMHSVPAQYRTLFAELGSPLTWPALYDLRMTGCDGERGPYHLEGVPKHPSEVARLAVDVDGDPGAPLHAVWTTRDGGTIDMRITEAITAGYQLPTHADADMAFGGYKIHASIDYGPYAVNEAVANSVFARPGS